MAEGILTTSWNATSEGLDVDWGQTIYSVKIQAKKDAKLSDILTIGSRVTAAESYTDGKTGSVALQFDALDLGEEVTLYQNAPNPATEYTNIEFYLPQEMPIQLVINDVSGKIIQKIEGLYASGKHTISFDTNELPSAQLYFYSLIAGDKVLTKKMVFVR